MTKIVVVLLGVWAAAVFALALGLTGGGGEVAILALGLAIGFVIGFTVRV